MKVHTDLADFQGVQRTVLTTGTFDGVHLGHRKILQRLNEVARKEEGESVLFTFHPHPRMVLFPHDNDLKLLTTQKEKIALLEDAGIDHLLIIPFSRTFSRMKALEYVRDVLVGVLNVHAVVIGYDHRFGRNREGDLSLLRQLGEAYDFAVEEIPAEVIDHVKVSSTKVREALLRGEVHLANDLLGYRYAMTGVVVKGDQLGRTLGFPTANIALVDPFKLVPGDGVYAVSVNLRNEVYGGMMSIGVRPTITNSGERTLEVNLFGLDRDIYGEMLTVHLHGWIRGQQRFDGLDGLTGAMHQDKDAALKILSAK
jgi:riboflavin kinase/FMN adenylyltransferase